jgi:chromosome segregation ATPase
MSIESPRLLRAAAALAASVVLGTSVAVAQPMQGQGGGMMQQGGQGGALMQKLQAKRNEVQALNQQLMQLQEETVAANPELADEREALQAHLESGMKEAGYDVAQGRTRIETLQSELESGELSPEKQQENREALRSELGDMRAAQGEAMENAEFKSRRQSLNEDMLAAMQEQNPEAEALIQDLQVAQREYQMLAQQAMQQREGGQGGMPSPDQ